jgi:plastocyanin
MPRCLWCAAAIVVAVGLACNNPSGGNSCRSVAADVTIDIHDAGGFSPTPVLVNKGQVVCWENPGSVTHSVITSVPATDTINEVLPPNTLFEHTFTQAPSDITYHCGYHPTEQGVITVR